MVVNRLWHPFFVKPILH
ncbi:hypothetical protein BLA29_002432 [Euroglyphus maynei]|uniref:Uncharacterized protein n=1 Tax=Euroglyphus maynei TaxID=6958 RepID=A0A1Y3B7V8_EURMA|nr:hypothetical protein BLA29_002432 [Euroglyphus maynei]